MFISNIQQKFPINKQYYVLTVSPPSEYHHTFISMQEHKSTRDSFQSHFSTTHVLKGSHKPSSLNTKGSENSGKSSKREGKERWQRCILVCWCWQRQSGAASWWIQQLQWSTLLEEHMAGVSLTTKPSLNNGLSQEPLVLATKLVSSFLNLRSCACACVLGNLAASFWRQFDINSI